MACTSALKRKAMPFLASPPITQQGRGLRLGYFCPIWVSSSAQSLFQNVWLGWPQLSNLHCHLRLFLPLPAPPPFPSQVSEPHCGRKAFPAPSGFLSLSPLLFSLWLSPVSISLSINYAPIFLHSLAEDYLGSYRREEIDSFYNNSFKFLPLNKHTYLCNLRIGVRVGDKESPRIFPRPVLPPHSHFLRALAPPYVFSLMCLPTPACH